MAMSDVQALEVEQAKVEAHPEWGQGPGTPYYERLSADLRAARQEADRG